MSYAEKKELEGNMNRKVASGPTRVMCDLHLGTYIHPRLTAQLPFPHSFLELLLPGGVQDGVSLWHHESPVFRFVLHLHCQPVTELLAPSFLAPKLHCEVKPGESTEF